MTRYRLRFLLQEFDLPRGATILGRSTDCHVTIEDPLVSRHHARIVLTGDVAVVHDLNSRNGVKINGVAVKAPTELKDGDRLRIGTQELVFCRVVAAVGASSAKTTGFLRHCARCRMPYAQESGACPGCGATELLDEPTHSAQFGASAQQIWSVQLYLEVLDRALRLTRVEDVHRILRRATTQAEERFRAGGVVDPVELEQLALGAARASVTLDDPTWGVWVADVYGRVPVLASEEVVAKLGELAARFPHEMAAPVEQLVAHARNVAPSEAHPPSLVALERVGAALAAFPRANAPEPALR